MIEVPPGGLQQLTSDEKIAQLKNLAVESFDKITAHQLPNGLIPASLGRYDDGGFRDAQNHGRVWIKDNVRAVKFALDPFVQKYSSELNDPQFIKERGLKKTAQELYLSAIQGILSIQSKSEQLSLFSTRPNRPRQDGYSTINEHKVPAIKFEYDGKRVDPWGHNQPDNWGTLLLESGKGIEQGLPVLSDKNGEVKIGDILQQITSYVTHLKTERLICRSLWEHSEGWSSYSTRRIVLAGLEQMVKVWEEIVLDSKSKGYGLDISKQQIVNAAGSLEEKVKEHFPADYTDSSGHESIGDLASMIVLNDIELPEDEQDEIIRRVSDLENRHGFYRYLGDPWKIGRAETKWIMGKPAKAKYHFKKSMNLYLKNRPRDGYRELDHGIERIDNIIDIQRLYNYTPELLEDKQGTGIYQPNNNELAWTAGYIEEASYAGIFAIIISELFYKDFRLLSIPL